MVLNQKYYVSLYSLLYRHFLGIFLFQFLRQIRIAHAVHIGNTITDQLINQWMIKEIQSRIQWKSLLFSKAFNNTAIFFLKQNRIRCHSVSLPWEQGGDSAFSVRKHICTLRTRQIRPRTGSTRQSNQPSPVTAEPFTGSTFCASCCSPSAPLPLDFRAAKSHRCLQSVPALVQHLPRCSVSLRYSPPHSAMPPFSAVLPIHGSLRSASEPKCSDSRTCPISPLSAPFPAFATATVPCTADRNRLRCFCRGKNKTRFQKAVQIAHVRLFEKRVLFLPLQKQRSRFLSAVHGTVAVAKAGNGADNGEIGQVRESEHFGSDADRSEPCIGSTAENGGIAECGGEYRRDTEQRGKCCTKAGTDCKTAVWLPPPLMPNHKSRHQ